MRAQALLLAAFFAAPFWESRPPSAWTDAELLRLLTDSPWAQPAGPAPAVPILLATAKPIRDAEAEALDRARRKDRRVPDEPDPDYADFLKEDGGKHIVVAVRVDARGFLDEAECRRMEQQSVMQVGRRRHGITGHFPPTSSDPYVRLVFPRDIQPGDKSVTFQLYLPGVTGNWKEAEFRLKDLVYQGRTEI